MHHIYDEIKQLPCHHCIYYGNYNSKCIKRSNESSEDGRYSPCDVISLDIDDFVDNIIKYFDIKNDEDI